MFSRSLLEGGDEKFPREMKGSASDGYEECWSIGVPEYWSGSSKPYGSERKY